MKNYVSMNFIQSKYFHCLFLCIAMYGSLIFNPAACYSASQLKICNLSQENLFFVGREDQLQQIHSFFKRGDRRILALTGGPGFGKTQIAKNFAQKFADDYDLIWWFDVQQDISNQFTKLALALNTLLPKKEHIIPQKMSRDVLVDTIKNILRVKQIRYLLVFDNAEEYARIEKFIPYAQQQLGKHVLLTSRIASIWPDKVEIGKFKREESLNLIKAAIPKEKKEEMVKLAETLDDYPLGLTIAVGFIKSHPTTNINKYLGMHVKRTLKKSEKMPTTLLDHYPKNALATLEISLRYIEEESKDSLQALFFMSLLNSKDIPETYISLWLKNAHSSLTADEAIKHVYDQSLLGVSETTEFNGNKKSEGQEDMHYLSMHDLIHQLINEKLSVEDKKRLLDMASDVLLEVFSGTADVFNKKVMDEPIHLLHAQKLCENAKEIGYSTSSLLQLNVCIFEFLMGPLRDFEAAKLMLEQIEKDLQLGCELEPYHKALFKIDKGFFESMYNVNYEEAIKNMSEGLAILTPFEEYKAERLRAISNLSQYHAMRGEINKANEFIRRGKSIFKESTSVTQNSFYIFMSAFILYDQGKFEEALEVLKKAKVYSNLLGEYPTLYHALLHQKIEILIKQRRLDEAQKNLEEYEEKIKEFFQGRYKKYLGLGSVLFFKSHILMYKGIHSAKTIQYLSDAIKLYNESFHGEKKNRYQARTHLALGKAHTLHKDYQNALDEYLLSEEIYDLILKQKNIDDVSELYTELALLGVKLKNDGLTHKYLKAHITFFGHSHPRTQEILHALDQKGLAVPF